MFDSVLRDPEPREPASAGGQEHAALHHDIHVGEQADVAQHVAADGDEVGEQPGLDRADPVVASRRSSAATTVAERIASSGVWPSWTIVANWRALIPCG